MATEKRLIDAYALEKKMFYVEETNGGHGWVIALEDLSKATTVDAVEVVHGRWEPRTDVIGFVRCSVCHDCNIYDDWADGKKWNYCPNCGAKMDGDGNGNS